VPRRSLHYLDALVGENLIESGGELGVTVPDEEPERLDPVAEIHDEVAGLLGGPGSGRIGRHAQDVHAPSVHLHDEQDVQPLQHDRVHTEEVASQQTVGLSAQERPPGRIHSSRCRTPPAAPQDPPHGRFTDPVTEPDQLAVHTSVAPVGILLCQP
jgi:hypothetical protein